MLTIGTEVDTNGFRGKVVGVMFSGGERQYFLIHHEVVTLVSADMIEPEVTEQQTER